VLFLRTTIIIFIFFPKSMVSIFRHDPIYHQVLSKSVLEKLEQLEKIRLKLEARDNERFVKFNGKLVVT
jgi:hypothetical protein